MNITEWCKKKECWEKVLSLPIRLNDSLAAELVSPDEARDIGREKRQQGALDGGIHAVTDVIQRGPGYWAAILDWARRHSPVYGREADLLRNASRSGWIPTPLQAACLIKVSARLQEEGFRPG